MTQEPPRLIGGEPSQMGASAPIWLGRAHRLHPAMPYELRDER